jgi:hypothetical protein
LQPPHTGAHLFYFTEVKNSVPLLFTSLMLPLLYAPGHKSGYSGSSERASDRAELTQLIEAAQVKVMKVRHKSELLIQ